MFAEKSFISWGRAETAIKLIDRGFPVSDSIEAAKVNGDLIRSLQYLQRECCICYETYPESRVSRKVFSHAKSLLVFFINSDVIQSFILL